MIVGFNVFYNNIVCIVVELKLDSLKIKMK